MTRFFAIPVLLLLTLSVKAQSVKIDIDRVMPYGVVDTGELKMKNCSFEKDANAVVLFDKADVTVNQWWDVTVTRHKRVKIFNSSGKDEANITLPFFDKVTDIKAETINLNGDKIEYTLVDPKLIYKQKMDTRSKLLRFTFPKVLDGSIIEMEYTWKITSQYYVPTWFFQSTIPTCYSEINTTIDNTTGVKFNKRINQPAAKDTLFNADHKISNVHIIVLTNVRSYVKEPYMTPEYDNIQRVDFTSYKNLWSGVSNELINDVDFGQQLNNKLTNEKAIIAGIATIKNNDIKIDSLFTLVKNNVKWNNIDQWYTDMGIQKAWDKKVGNSTEINLILCRLLLQAGINAYPMMVSTPDYGVADPTEVSLLQFNKAVVYIPVDSTRSYVLDASNKHYAYNLKPFELLSTYGFAVSPATRKFGLINIVNDSPAQQTVFIRAAINANGKMTGTAVLIDHDYNKYNSLKLYQTLGRKNYIDLLKGGNNNLKIDSLKMENMEADSLPLAQYLKFEFNEPANDENYIYFNLNIFTLGTNPFLSEKRYSNIDFTYNNIYRATCLYTIPPGYKVEALPKNQLLVMEDKSMSIKRVVGEENGVITMHYIISRQRSFYSKDEYNTLHDFYKKMHEMLNEQIVLKKV